MYRFFKSSLVGVLLICVMALLHGCEDEETASINDDDSTPIVIAPEDRLPQFAINTNGAAIVDEPKINATFTISVQDQLAYEGAMGIEIRGSSSQQFPKKSYGFETRDAQNEDLDVSLLNMPEEEDWILYAPYSDKSLIRNALIYDLSRAMDRYASRVELVEVTINDVYNGLYVFMEKLKRDDNRIDLNNLKDDENSGEDLTGGYILKIDKVGGPGGQEYTAQNSFPSTFAPPQGTFQTIKYVYDDPDEDDITQAQRTYIQDYINAFETALAGDNFQDEELGYNAYIDADSFIDFFILNELSNNVDGYRLSTWLTKDKNEKLKMGPIWDFNLAFGNADYCNGGATDVWAYKFNERCSGDFWLIPFWWERLLQDPAFVARLKDRWSTLRGGVLSTSSILNRVDSYKTQIEKSGAAAENFQRWPVLGVYVWPNNFVGSDYDEEIDYLSNWIENRVQWLDQNIEGL